ncbi:MAG TPA: septum formation initiator family protein [Rhodospirillales bacterium]|nr:septum formation initiator family protein [Rhodospirillales bacterium]
MSLIRELRIRARHVLFPAVAVAAVVYVAWHGVNGDRGVVAWRSLEREVDVARAELHRVRAARESLDRRVRLLYPQSLDPDMLDESARRLLNYGLPEEVVILDPLPATR